MNELRSMHNNPLDSNFLALSYTVGWSITHRPFAGGSPEAGGKADTLYDLCGVANHRGTAENGHCYAFVKDSAGSGGGYGGAGDAGAATRQAALPLLVQVQYQPRCHTLT